MAKRNQFWSIVYTLDGKTYGYDGNDGQSKENAIADLHSLRGKDGKIEILRVELMEFDPFHSFYSDVKTMTRLKKDKTKMNSARLKVFAKC